MTSGNISSGFFNEGMLFIYKEVQGLNVYARSPRLYAVTVTAYPPGPAAQLAQGLSSALLGRLLLLLAPRVLVHRHQRVHGRSALRLLGRKYTVPKRWVGVGEHSGIVYVLAEPCKLVLHFCSLSC